MLMWAGNTVAARMAASEMSPMIISSLRWLITCLILTYFGWQQLRVDWPQIRPRLGYMFLLALSGFSLFNALFYYAAHLTSGINLSIIQGSIPIFVLLGAFIGFGIKSSWYQILGVMLSLVGILVVASHGELEILKSLTFNRGDILLLIACFFSAVYALGLRSRPKISALSFFMFLAFAAFATTLPMMAVEYMNGDMIMPSAKGWWILAYIIVFPSTIAQLFYIYSIEHVGASRAGIFVNLIPVLGALLSVLVLSEQFGLYHAVSLVLVLSGIMLAEWGKKN